MRAKKKITSVNLSPDILKKIKERARRERRSVSAYIEVLAERDLATASKVN
jgi:hypothetical protein